MKKLLCIFTTCLLIISCGSEEQEATHNASELNESVLDNKKVVTQEITLEEISSYYGDEQKEIFSLLTPENKKRLWEEKFDQLLVLTHNEDERLLLNRIYDEAKKMDFSKSLEDEDEEILALNNLVAEGISMFQWNDVYIDITFSSFEFYEEGKEDYKAYTHRPILQLEEEGEGMTAPNYCTCRWHSLIKDCKKGGCIETDWGCGWLLLQPCTGKFFRF